MSDVVRLINASKGDFEKMTAMDLKESIFKSEGRVVCGQHLLFAGNGLVRGVTNTEVMFSWKAEMIMFDNCLDDPNAVLQRFLRNSIRG